ncbi:MAG TPA: tetratricopeptide repeat protein [Candidatus Tectomicrobia bacterium]|jgi:tetratricopeptide (TPR) repeat protein
MLGRLTKAERLFSRGQTLVAQDNLEAALAAFSEALTLRPCASGMRLHWALALAAAGRLQEAVEAMQQAITQQPTNPVLPMFLGQIYLDHAEYTQAQTWCERALALNPHNIHALALHSLTDMALGKIDQGYQCLKHEPLRPRTKLERTLLRCRKGSPPSLLHLTNAACQSRLLLFVETYLLQQGKQARTLSQQLRQTSARPAALSQTYKCLAALDRLFTHGVLGIKQLCIRLRYVGQPNPRTFWLRQTDAEKAYYLGQTEDALRLYTQLLQQEPDCHIVRQQAFELCYEQGDFRHALEHLQRLVTQRPATATPDARQAFVHGELLYRQEQYHKAASCLAQAMTLGVQDYKLFYYLGLCHLRAGARREAHRRFAQAVRLLNPGIIELRLDELYRVSQSLPSTQAFLPSADKI